MTAPTIRMQLATATYAMLGKCLTIRMAEMSVFFLIVTVSSEVTNFQNLKTFASCIECHFHSMKETAAIATDMTETRTLTKHCREVD